MQDQAKETSVIDYLRDFIRLESAGGILLFAATVMAMLINNSPLAVLDNLLLETTVAVQVGALIVSKPLLL